MRNLVLSDEINKVIEEGKFKIYTIETVKEAMEILTDSSFDEIKDLVKEQLEKFSKIERGNKN